MFISGMFVNHSADSISFFMNMNKHGQFMLIGFFSFVSWHRSMLSHYTWHLHIYIFFRLTGSTFISDHLKTFQGRVRVFSLVVKLFSTSANVAEIVHNSNLLSLLEAEARNTDDTLVTLSILELYYEVCRCLTTFCTVLILPTFPLRLLSDGVGI